MMAFPSMAFLSSSSSFSLSFSPSSSTQKMDKKTRTLSAPGKSSNGPITNSRSPIGCTFIPLLIVAVALLLVCCPDGTEARVAATFPRSSPDYGMNFGGDYGQQSGDSSVAPWRTPFGQQVAPAEEQQRPMEKRRLVVRVPFAQNPDGHQLSRIYKSLFEPSNSRAKKQPWAYSLRHFMAADDDQMD